jgi:hypothetical protein
VEIVDAESRGVAFYDESVAEQLYLGVLVVDTGDVHTDVLTDAPAVDRTIETDIEGLSAANGRAVRGWTIGYIRAPGGVE